MNETSQSRTRRPFWRLQLALLILAILTAVTFIPARFIPAGPLRDLHRVLVDARDRGLGRSETRNESRPPGTPPGTGGAQFQSAPEPARPAQETR